MQENVLYISFAALVQISVAFDFGLLYIFKNNRFILKSILGELNKWSFFQKCIRIAKDTIRGASVNDLSESLNLRRGRLQKSVDIFSSTYQYERVCDNLAMTGVVSGLFSVLWLIFIPWSISHGTHMEDVYMTSSVCTFISIVWVTSLAYRYRKKDHTRAKILLIAFGSFVLCLVVGLVMLRCNIAVNTSMDFDMFFLISVIVLPFGPVFASLIQLLVSFLIRVFNASVLLFKAVNLQFDINKHLKIPTSSRISYCWNSLVR